MTTCLPNSAAVHGRGSRREAKLRRWGTALQQLTRLYRAVGTPVGRAMDLGIIEVKHDNCAWTRRRALYRLAPGFCVESARAVLVADRLMGKNSHWRVDPFFNFPLALVP